MTEQAQIKQVIELLMKARLNIPDGITRADDAICSAIDLLESIKTEPSEPITGITPSEMPKHWKAEPFCPNCGLRGEQAKLPHTCRKPPAGEFTKKQRERIERDTSLLLCKTHSGLSNKLTWQALHVIAGEALEHLGEACDRLDAKDEQINRLELAVAGGIKLEKAQTERIEKLKELATEGLSICKSQWRLVDNHPGSSWARDVAYFEEALKENG